MAKPHRNLKKANHGARPANSKARKAKRKAYSDVEPINDQWPSLNDQFVSRGLASMKLVKLSSCESIELLFVLSRYSAHRLGVFACLAKINSGFFGIRRESRRGRH